MSTPVRRYYRGRTLVGMRDVQAASTRYYHFDHQGTTQCLTDSTGAVTDRFASDAWGVEVKRTGSSINRQWFIGREGYYHHTAASKSYVRHRHYSQGLGAWLSFDPLTTPVGSVVHALSIHYSTVPLRDQDVIGLLSRSNSPGYAYAWSSPARRTDPKGLDCLGGVSFNEPLPPFPFGPLTCALSIGGCAACYDCCGAIKKCVQGTVGISCTIGGAMYADYIKFIKKWVPGGKKEQSLVDVLLTPNALGMFAVGLPIRLACTEGCPVSGLSFKKACFNVCLVFVSWSGCGSPDNYGGWATSSEWSADGAVHHLSVAQ